MLQQRHRRLNSLHVSYIPAKYEFFKLILSKAKSTQREKKIAHTLGFRQGWF